ncbi:calcium-binding protein [Actibacterium sp. D379-3]
MATITGTSGADILTGTADDDIIKPLGVSSSNETDFMSGGNGADTYDLYRFGGGPVMNFVIDDQGTDGAPDVILNAGGLYHSASLGYVGWATAERVGDDLIIDLPADPDRFHDPGSPAYHIEIVDHFGGGAVESIQCAGVTYTLPTTGNGTNLNDIIAGNDLAERQTGRGGDDWMFGNGGGDAMSLGAGNDTAFGGAGDDRIGGGDGDDRLEGEEGDDLLHGGNGQNHILGGDGNDRIIAGDGYDWLEGGTGRDKIRGGAGRDTIDGGLGDDLMSGGADGDVYVFGVSEGVADWGHDVIVDQGNAPSYLNEDRIDLRGFYGPSSGSSAEAFSAVHFTRAGSDMVISFEGDQASVRVVDMFTGTAGFIEELTFNGAYWDPLTFQIVDGAREDLGNDRDHGSYGSELNEILFGTNAGDEIFGGSGTNFIWTGGGSDTIIYKLNDPNNLGGMGGGASHDIVEDFDVTRDTLDFSETELGFDDLTISEDAEGDALITWYTADWEISDIVIELRGVSAAEVSEDIFVF